eukprot:3274165-Rhodomonas_salina.1
MLLSHTARLHVVRLVPRGPQCTLPKMLACIRLSESRACEEEGVGKEKKGREVSGSWEVWPHLAFPYTPKSNTRNRIFSTNCRILYQECGFLYSSLQCMVPGQNT